MCVANSFFAERKLVNTDLYYYSFRARVTKITIMDMEINVTRTDVQRGWGQEPTLYVEMFAEEGKTLYKRYDTYVNHVTHSSRVSKNTCTLLCLKCMSLGTRVDRLL